jgi:hypothetical protein
MTMSSMDSERLKRNIHGNKSVVSQEMNCVWRYRSYQAKADDGDR